MALFFLALAFSNKLMSFKLPFLVLPLLGLLSGLKPHLQLLALVTPYSGNPKVRYYIVFNLGPFYINKAQLLPLFFLTLNGDFGVKAHPSLPANIFGILVAPQLNPCGQTFWPSSHEQPSGLPLYDCANVSPTKLTSSCRAASGLGSQS